MSLIKKLKSPPRKLDLLSGLIIRFGGLYSTGGWLLCAILSAGFWATRWRVIPSFFLLSLISILVGILAAKSVYESLKSGGMAVKLLKKGIATRGTLVAVNHANAATDVKVINLLRKIPGEHRQALPPKSKTDAELHSTLEEVYKQSIKYQPESVIVNYHVKFRADNGGEYFAKGTTNYRDGQTIEDEPEELVLYLKKKPNKAVIFDAIFHVPALRFDGSFEPVERKKAVYLILPFLVLVGNGVCLFLYFT